MNLTQLLAILDQHQSWPYFALVFGIDDVFVMLALMVVSAAITALTAKSPSTTAPTPALITDFNFPQIAEGTPQVVVFGDVWLTEWQVLWYGDLRSEGIPAPTPHGKK